MRRRLRIGRLIATIFVLAIVAVLVYASTFVVSYGDLFRRQDPLVRMDVARLAPARVERVDRVRDLEQLRRIVGDAALQRLKVSISGSRHSQGGHTYTTGGVVLDMRG